MRMTSRLGVILAILALGWLLRDRGPGRDVAVDPAPTDATTYDSELAPIDPIERAFQTGQSDLVVEGSGVVQRLLPDDLEGSRHQKFILKLDSGQTILISHNIDLAPRVPLEQGDRVEFRGEYEWNERGGVVHWTHHDPRGARPGGWLRHRGETYR